MLETYMSYAGKFFNELNDLQERQEKRKVEILKEFEESKKLPRKKKKQVRKELRLEWNIVNYNIFEGFL